MILSLSICTHDRIMRSFSVESIMESLNAKKAETMRVEPNGPWTAEKQMVDLHDGDTLVSSQSKVTKRLT